MAPRLGVLTGVGGEQIKADFSFLAGSSVLFDAVYVPGGETSVETLEREPEAVNFLNEAYKHCKTIAATGAGVELLDASDAAGDRAGDSVDPVDRVVERG
jgi:catalase